MQAKVQTGVSHQAKLAEFVHVEEGFREPAVIAPLGAAHTAGHDVSLAVDTPDFAVSAGIQHLLDGHFNEMTFAWLAGAEPVGFRPKLEPPFAFAVPFGAPCRSL